MSATAFERPAAGVASGTGSAPVTPSAPPARPQQGALREVCPLCGETLRSEQDWCLRCGAAARTRLAAPAKWKFLVLALGTIALLSLGVLVAALVELAG